MNFENLLRLHERFHDCRVALDAAEKEYGDAINAVFINFDASEYLKTVEECTWGARFNIKHPEPTSFDLSENFAAAFPVLAHMVIAAEESWELKLTYNTASTTLVYSAGILQIEKPVDIACVQLAVAVECIKRYLAPRWITFEYIDKKVEK